MLDEHDRTTAAEPAISGENPERSDAELVGAALRTPHAFELLYLRYADRLYRYVAGLTGSTTLADDIVSDTMIAAFEHLAQFDPARGTFAGWLFTIARRRVADDQRRLGRLRRAFSRHGPEPVAEDDILSGIIRTEEAAHLRAAMLRVPRNDRDVLLLRYVVGLSGPEIAEVLGISSGAMRTRLHRAMRRLANELGERDASG